MKYKQQILLKSPKSILGYLARYYLCVMFLLVLGLTGAYAQETITTAGGEASGSGGTASYTVGQLVFNTYGSVDGLVTQGVQQPFEIYTVTGIDELDISLNMSVYPNPTTNYLILRINDIEYKDILLHKCILSLYNINGELIKTQKITSSETNIDMSYIAIGSYFLSITMDSKGIKTFKIIKN
ncbi:MAG: T9SS type A sorting domain-containing protein [Bacteroidales bacterium]|nr:T9SS type A sorting domain-containing protein [Bacteroidales bacterium]